MELYNIAHKRTNLFIRSNPDIGAGRAKLIAVLYDASGCELALGWNQYKSHPLQAKYADHPDKIYLHAEIDAIANSLRRYRGINGVRLLEGSSMYIFRFNKNMSLGLAKPCVGCQRAIRAFNIKTVFWSGE